MFRLFLVLCLVFNFSIHLFSQHGVSGYSQLIGEWQLSSPKNSPGPEFIPETYKGISRFTINPSGIPSVAVGINPGNTDTAYRFTFTPEWDGIRLSGQIESNTWTKYMATLQVSVPFEYDKKKDRIVIHINNPEYGNVKFIYHRVKS